MQLFLIILLGFLLRVSNIIKPEGLWNDEYVSYFIANIPMGAEFWSAVKTQCHLPLYYLYLKLMMFIGSDSDTFLRFTSLIVGVLAIPVMYLVGKEVDKSNKKIAVIAALITAFSSFLIYYSQEVRFYQLLFLFSALSLLFTLRLISNFNKKNLAFYLASNLFVLMTHTIGFIFVFFNMVYVICRLFIDKKITRKQILFIILFPMIIFLALSPLIMNIFKMSGIAQWWGIFSIRNIGFLFTDWFSPVLTNLVNAPALFIYKNGLSFKLYLLIPTISAIIAMVIGGKKYKGFVIVSILYVFTLVIASILGKLVFITKYAIEVYPILIMFVAIGFAETKKHNMGKILLLLYFVPNFLYVFHPEFATKLPRNEGHKIVASLLEQSEIKQNDTLIFTYYDESRFNKYIKTENYNVISINKGNVKNYYGLGLNDRYLKEKNFEILSENLDNRVVKNSKNKVYIVFLNSVEFFTKNQIFTIISSESLVEKVPEQYLYFSGVKNELVEKFSKKYAKRTFISQGSWTVAIFN